MSSIEAPSLSHLWRIVWRTSDVTGTGSREPEMKGIYFLALFSRISRVFSGTPLDSRYERWHFEFNQSSAFSYLNPTNRSPSCFEFKSSQSYAFDLNPTNGKPSLTGHTSTFRCTFVYLKKSFHVLISSSTDVIRFQDCLYYFQFLYCASDSQTSILLQGKTNLLFL